MMSDKIDFDKRNPLADRLGVERRRSYNNDDEMIPEPVFAGWQLIGDSQFLRFSERFLGKTRRKKDGFAYIGLCVSGQRTEDLLARMKEKFRPIAERVILMVGTNDLLKGTNSTVLRANIQKVVLYLHNDAKVRDIIILTIPPVPRLAASLEHWRTLKAFNEHIKTFDKGNGIRVIDAYASFIKDDEYSRISVSVSRDSLSSVRNSPPSVRNSPSSRSSLVSHSSDYTSPLLRSTTNSIIKPPYTSNFEKLRTNLRIRVGDIPENRTIYVMDSDEEKAQREAEEEADSSDDDGYLSVKPMKRSSYLSGLPTPDSKRLSLGSGSYSSKSSSYNIAQDDHNDRFHTNGNNETLEHGEEIHLEYFEKFFDTNCTRPDLIHLNTKGLRVIQRLLEDVL